MAVCTTCPLVQHSAREEMKAEKINLLEKFQKLPTGDYAVGGCILKKSVIFQCLMIQKKQIVSKYSSDQPYNTTVT